MEVSWWLFVSLILGIGQYVEGDGSKLAPADLKQPKMVFLAKIIEEKKEKERKMLVTTIKPEEEKEEEEMSESESDSDSDNDSNAAYEEDAEGLMGDFPGRGTEMPLLNLEEAKHVVLQRAAPPKEKGNSTWDVYIKSKGKGRSMGTVVEDKPGANGTKTKNGTGGAGGGGGKKDPKGEGDNATKENTSGGGNSSGGTRKPKKPTSARPYNVIRARPGDQVDPSGYNFFQLQPKSQLGWLWMARTKPGMKPRLHPVSTDDDGFDIDDKDPANLFNWEFRRYDRACLYLEYNMRKAEAKIPLVSEEIKRLVDLQNEKIARKFINWQFHGSETPEQIALGDKGPEHPHGRSFKFLQKIVSIFTQKICKTASSYVTAAASQAPYEEAQKALLTGANDNSTIQGSEEEGPPFLPKIFVENLFSLFLVLRNMTLTGSVKDYPSKEDEELIFDKFLKQCDESGESVPWFVHSCGDHLLSYDHYKNYACTPFVDYDFNVRKYDPILDTVWHMFNAVHSYCFEHFMISPRMWHKFSMIIANAFTPEMRLRWKASVASESFYVRLLGPDYSAHFDTINRCMFGATERSNAPLLLPRFDTMSMTTFGVETE